MNQVDHDAIDRVHLDLVDDWFPVRDGHVILPVDICQADVVILL